MKRCPSADDSVTDCCLVIEGDGSIMAAEDGTTAEGGFALAVKSVTTEIPSQITVDDQGEKEYRLRWNPLATHTAFSRVIPDIGSLSLKNPFTGNTLERPRVFGNSNANNRPSFLGVPDVALAVSKQIRDNINIPNDNYGNRNNKDRWGKRNDPSGKCWFQRRRGAREREATMFLEHFYVAYGGEDETHQLNKRANLLPLNYTRHDFTGPEKTHPPHGFHGIDDKDFPPEYNADGGNDAWSMENPFAIETRFSPNEGNYEKHVRMPTSRQRLWFNGGLDLDNANTYDNIRDPATSYYGNIPCLECRTEVAGSIEKVIPALLKRYGYQNKDSKIYQACSAAFKDSSGNLWPYYVTNPHRFYDDPKYQYGICHADEL